MKVSQPMILHASKPLATILGMKKALVIR